MNELALAQSTTAPTDGHFDFIRPDATYTYFWNFNQDEDYRGLFAIKLHTSSGKRSSQLVSRLPVRPFAITVHPDNTYSVSIEFICFTQHTTVSIPLHVIHHDQDNLFQFLGKHGLIFMDQAQKDLFAQCLMDFYLYVNKYTQTKEFLTQLHNMKKLH